MSSSSSSDSEPLFLTSCCGRPICPSCLTSNPRLARYNPCLACLGGVGAVGTKRLQGQHPVASNVDGAVRDEDVFIVGDEDEDEEGAADINDGVAANAGVALPPSEGPRPPEPDVEVRCLADADKPEEPTGNDQGSPGRYYIRPDDTLLGISLRLGVDVSTTSLSLPFGILDCATRAEHFAS
jgi:hypothetical protein